MVVGQDHSGTITGTVTVGNQLTTSTTLGLIGIICAGDGIDSPATILDADLAGESSLVIQRQQLMDMQVRTIRPVSLASSPVFGLPALGSGISSCPESDSDAIGLYVAGFAGVEISNPDISMQSKHICIHICSAWDWHVGD